MVVNLNKFWPMVINSLGKLEEFHELLINNHKIDSENSVTLSDIEIDKKLNFEKYVKALCQKASQPPIKFPACHT